MFWEKFTIRGKVKAKAVFKRVIDRRIAGHG